MANFSRRMKSEKCWSCGQEKPVGDTTSALSLEYLNWLIDHFQTCKPRPIVDVHLPEMKDDDG